MGVDVLNRVRAHGRAVARDLLYQTLNPAGVSGIVELDLPDDGIEWIFWTRTHPAVHWLAGLWAERGDGCSMICEWFWEDLPYAANFPQLVGRAVLESEQDPWPHDKGPPPGESDAKAWVKKHRRLLNETSESTGQQPE